MENSPPLSSANGQGGEKNFKLPGKLNKVNTVRPLGEQNVVLNAYQMEIGHDASELFLFELEFTAHKMIQRGDLQEEKMVKLAEGPKNDEAEETRRRLGWELFQQLLASNPDFFGTDTKAFVYDCAQKLYSSKHLGMGVNELREFQLDVDRNALEERCRHYIRNYPVIRANLLRTELVINLRDKAAANVQDDRSVVDFLELLTSQRLYEQQSHYCFDNRMYDSTSVIQLRELAPVLKKGLQKGVRFVGDSLEDAKPMLQIDPKKSAFFPGQSLLQFACNFINARDGFDLERQIGREDYVLQQLHKQIKALVLQTTHLPDTQITFCNMGLTSECAQDIRFTQHDGREVNVVQYFYEHYQHRLRHPRLPCVIRRTPQMECYYPMEVLSIVEGQRVPMEKQTPKLTEQMIRECQVKPANMAGQIHEQKDAAGIRDANPFFQAHNLHVEQNLMRAKAQLLYPPAIRYDKGDTVEPDNRGDMNWKMSFQQRRYLKPAEWPAVWTAVIIQNAVGGEQCERFIDALLSTARSRGIANACKNEMGVRCRFDHWQETDIETLQQKFKYLQNNNCKFVLFFAKGKKQARPGDIHHRMKLMEQQYKIQTQHISPEIMHKGISDRGAQMVLDNILLKTNLKLGGINWSLVTPRVQKAASRSEEDIHGQVWLGSKRMFFGLDFSHAPPQSLYERQKGEVVAIPTVVGMAYTLGREVLRMRGTYWMQQPRQATIDARSMRPFTENIREALLAYEQQNGEFPAHLVVFRGGASEGEFKRVAYWEGGAFLEAFKAICMERKKTYPEPALTFIVCQRTSNYRMLPEHIDGNKPAALQNVRPGTVVDRGVMNAGLTEFLLVAHKALQGTAQPIRCTIVREYRPFHGPGSAVPPRIPLEELEYITNDLAYSHGICCMPTALPGPLFEAAELAKRGRNNWKTHTNDGASVPHIPLGQNGSAEQQMNNARADHFVRISTDLKPVSETKFWA